MAGQPPAARPPPIASIIPPLILGTGTFNNQYVADPSRMPYVEVTSRAVARGVRAFDTSPYYGPSEALLGDALSRIEPQPPRDSLFLITKAGRIASSEFDYSPRWIRYSVCRSLERLRTSYLDLVYLHDVEFVPVAQVVEAVRELRRLRDEGRVRYVGICGFPIRTLAQLAQTVRDETGEPVDAVQSYGNFTVQNSRLGSAEILAALRDAGVGVIPNASMLGMGLLTTRGADRGPMAAWHPAPKELQITCRSLAKVAAEAGLTLEQVALRWSMLNWARVGAELGSTATGFDDVPRMGVSVMGVVAPAELEETVDLWERVVGELRAGNGNSGSGGKVNELVESRMWPALGRWRDYAWESGGPAFKNLRPKGDQVPDDEVSRKYNLVGPKL